jgi:hypothetical protein
VHLPVNRSRASSARIQTEAIGLRLPGDLGQKCGLGIPGYLIRVLALELGPREVVGQRLGIDPDQGRDRAGRSAMRRAIDEEVRPGERVGSRRVRQVEWIRRVALGGKVVGNGAARGGLGPPAPDRPTRSRAGDRGED